MNKNKLSYIANGILIVFSLVLLINYMDLSYEFDKLMIRFEAADHVHESGEIAYGEVVDLEVSVQTGEKFPRFKALSPKGGDVTLPQEGDDTKIFVFSSLYCDYCPEYYHELSMLAKQHKNLQVAVMIDDLADSVALERMSLDHPNVEFLSIQEAFLDSMGITFIPTSFILNHHNIVDTVLNITQDLTSLEHMLENNIAHHHHPH